MRKGLTQGRCPKCGGNLFLDRDLYGWYEQCLQCSYTGDLEAVIERQDGTRKATFSRDDGKKAAKSA